MCSSEILPQSPPIILPEVCVACANIGYCLAVIGQLEILPPERRKGAELEFEDAPVFLRQCDYILLLLNLADHFVGAHGIVKAQRPIFFMQVNRKPGRLACPRESKSIECLSVHQ